MKRNLNTNVDVRIVICLKYQEYAYDSFKIREKGTWNETG
jgi:hypothetical protein